MLSRCLKPCILLALSAIAAAFLTAPVYASGNLTPVDDTSQANLEASATLAFHRYLKSIDANQANDAYEQVLDPEDPDLRFEVIDRLLGFIRARVKSPVRNEACVVRTAGQWALVVYQYDTTIAGKTARVITTAWMLQSEGFWRQFILAPADPDFWDTRRSDYDKLQRWFDDHAGQLVSAA